MAKLSIKSLNMKQLFFSLTVMVELLFFLCMQYGDSLITAMHGLNFWDCLFSGNIRNFYEQNSDAVLNSGVYYGNYSAYYDFGIYIIFAIWVFPLWLGQKILKYSLLTKVIGPLWVKLFTVLFLAVCSFLIKKILETFELEKEQIFNALYVFITSCITAVYIFGFGQYDTVTIVFILLGIYLYVKNRMWLFTFIFALALPVKFFAIIAYILLLIYKEKRVFKLILHMAVSLIPIVLLRIAIPFAGESNTGVFATLLFSNVLPVSISAVLFFVVMVVLCAAVYVTKPSDDKLLNNKRIVYISFLGYAAFLLFTTPLPYWYLYLVPFMAMLIAFDKEKLLANLFFEAVASFATVFSHIFVHAHCFSSAIVNNTPLASIIGNKPEINVMFPQLLQKYLSEEFYNQFGNYFAPVFSSLALGAFALYIFFNFPSSKKYNLVSDEKVLTDIYLVRLLMVGCLMSIPVLCFILG